MGGSAYSLALTHAFIGFVVLVYYVFCCRGKPLPALLSVLTIGLSPWWILATAHPWNGRMYLLWIFAGLATLWYRKNIFLPALLLGIGFAIHLSGILVLPILVYEWLSRKNKLKNFVYIFLGLTIPWVPIIVFEIITRGYLIREWLGSHTLEAGWEFILINKDNLVRIIAILGYPLKWALILLIIIFLVAQKRERYWIALTILPVVIISPKALLEYYLLGTAFSLLLTALVILSRYKWGLLILALMAVSSLGNIKFPPSSPRYLPRSIPLIERVVKTTILNNNLDRSKKYALVSVNDTANSTPQADDYRFFFRIKGYNAVGIDEYPNADFLFLFVETPLIDSRSWGDWHMGQFGDRELVSFEKVGGIEVLMYKRKN
jgi:hypothetical protein